MAEHYLRVHVHTTRQPNFKAFEPNSLHPDVALGIRLLPTMTTPAPTAAGRPSPSPALKFPADVLARWRDDGQRFAPWHYYEQAMLRMPQG
eukprot:3135987-Amphidinium_carterae.1